MLSHSSSFATRRRRSAANHSNPHVISKITQEFGINRPCFLAQMLSFAVVAFILWRFAFKPVLATLDERQKKIASGLGYAEEMKAKLEAAQQEIAAQLKEAQVEGPQIVAEAQKAAKEFADRQQKEAVEQGQRDHDQGPGRRSSSRRRRCSPRPAPRSPAWSSPPPSASWPRSSPRRTAPATTRPPPASSTNV